MPMSPTPSAISPTISSAQRLRQELGQRIGVGQHLHLAGEPARVGAQILAQPLGLAQDRARMLQQGTAGRRRRHPLAPAHQQRRAERLLHVSDARRRRCKRKMRALGAVRDAARLDHMAKQAQVGEVEPHVVYQSFASDEASLRLLPIVC
jgi:hypothetical protein